MRYSTIHHDVRNKFGLTLSEYLVCDSIHQLSHGQPTTKTNTDIANFLGVDRSHVGKIKQTLSEKGLIEITDTGVTTTDVWYDAVTFAKTGKIPANVGKSPQNGENPRHTIYNKDNKDKGEQSSQEEDVEIIPDESVTPTRTLQSKKKPPKKQSLEVYQIFADVRGKKYPQNWLVNKTQRAAADNLVSERGLKAIRSALNFHKEYQDEDFCPEILSPYDLDSKWDKLAAFKKKKGL